VPAEDPPRPPWFVLETTPRCNLECIFCCNPWKDAGYSGPSGLPAATSRIIERLSSTTRIGGITISGGEPLTAPDLRGTVEAASRASPELILATNGTILDRREAIELAGGGLTDFQISLPAARDSTFRAICGSDLRKDAVRGISSAAATGIPVSVAFPVCTLNWSEAGEVILLAFASGASSFQLLPLAPGGLATGSWAGLRVLGMLGEAVEKTGIRTYTGIPLPPCEWGRFLPPGLVNDGCFGAGCKWAIDPWGSVRPCEQVGIVLGSIFDRSFDEIRLSGAAAAFRAMDCRSGCPECSQKPVCRGGCRAYGLGMSTLRDLTEAESCRR
jgi:radical SAM protein with 4Fe4S-binding SPASM domain